MKSRKVLNGVDSLPFSNFFTLLCALKLKSLIATFPPRLNKINNFYAVPAYEYKVDCVCTGKVKTE